MPSPLSLSLSFGGDDGEGRLEEDRFGAVAVVDGDGVEADVVDVLRVGVVTVLRILDPALSRSASAPATLVALDAVDPPLCVVDPARSSSSRSPCSRRRRDSASAACNSTSTCVSPSLPQRHGRGSCPRCY